MEGLNMNSITVVDGICGSGKTQFCIQYMNEYGREFNIDRKLFIYVTPYLTEIERIKRCCPELRFSDPINKGEGKLKSLKKLIATGENIATTHTLFTSIDEEVLELLKNSGYTLILDEVLNVINEYPISRADMNLLLKGDLCSISDNMLKWNDSCYTGKFQDLKLLSDIGNIHYYRDSFLFWTITPDSFKVFDEVFVLTYLFNGQIQRYFYDLHNITYNMKSIIKEGDVYKLVDYDKKYDNREMLKDMLDIYEDSGKSKLNSNYVKKVTNTTLSSTSLRNMNSENYDRIKRNIDTFFRNNCKATTKEVFWTTLTVIAPNIKGKYNTYKLSKNKNIKQSYDRDKCNFVSHNARATNYYGDRKYCAYVYNRFMHPIEKAFFEDNNVNVDEDLLALSDLIQWIFRGSIRNNIPMKLYIPSVRMRELLYKFLNYEL
jgi:hypothetical protein